MHGLDTSNVSSRVESSRAKWNLSLWQVRLLIMLQRMALKGIGFWGQESVMSRVMLVTPEELRYSRLLSLVSWWWIQFLYVADDGANTSSFVQWRIWGGGEPAPAPFGRWTDAVTHGHVS